jgi:hypothetical protein
MDVSGQLNFPALLPQEKYSVGGCVDPTAGLYAM